MPQTDANDAAAASHRGAINEQRYCGPISWIIGIFLHPCICCCGCGGVDHALSPWGGPLGG
jgi:hypothetical protein